MNDAASKPTKPARIDCHRPGAIVPRDYTHLLSYTLPGLSDENPGCNDDVAVATFSAAAETAGAIGRCAVCSKPHRHGDLFRHVSGAIVVMGHDCADTYQLAADRADWNASREMARRAAEARAEERARNERLAAFYAARPELRDALEHDHEILSSLRQKVRRWGSLSPKQEALAFSVYSECHAPARPPRVISPGQHQGTVGKRATFKATLTRIVRHEGGYRGEGGYVVIFASEDGSDMVWFTSAPPCNKPAEKDGGNGKVYGGPIPVTLKATVKAHDERNGRAQTVLTRVAVTYPAGCPQTWDQKMDLDDAEQRARWAAQDGAA